MLMLSRKAGESIVIDGCISVLIHEIDGAQVRLGISAPPEIRVDRGEIHERWRAFIESCQMASSEVAGQADRCPT